MNLYLFEYMYEDGERWEICADTLDEALGYFRQENPHIHFTIQYPHLPNVLCYLVETFPNGTITISVEARHIQRGVLKS